MNQKRFLSAKTLIEQCSLRQFGMVLAISVALISTNMI